MSLISSLAKKIAPAASALKNVGVGVAKGAGSIINDLGSLGRSIQGGISSGVKTVTGKDLLPMPKTGPFDAGTASNTALQNAIRPNNTAQQIGSIGLQAATLFSPKTLASGAKNLPGLISGGAKAISEAPGAISALARNLASKGAGKAGSEVAEATPRLVDGIRPGSTAGKIEAKTTTARTTPQIDTTPRPASPGTIKTPRPILTGTLAGAGALGIAAAMNGAMNGGQGKLPGDVTTDGTQPSPDATSAFAPESVFGPTTAFASAPDAGGGASSSFGTPAGGIAPGGFGSAPGSPLTGAGAGQSGGTTERDKILKRILELSEPTDDEEENRKNEEQIARQIAKLTGNQELENLEIEGEPIAADAREGRRGMISRETRRSLVPLQTSLALVQALRERNESDRTAKIDALKYQYDSTKPEDGGGFTLGSGQQRYQLNPTTGQYELVGQVADESKGGELLSVTEAQALGVPYGTTREQAFGNTPQKAPTQGQYAANLYATRMGEANQIMATLQNDIIAMNPALFAASGAIEPSALGNPLVGEKFRQQRQAERNFLNAVLRRESGAVISPTEFAEGARQYFPRPGDDAQTLLNKAQARQTAINGLQQEAAGSFQGFGSIPVAQGGGGTWNW